MNINVQAQDFETTQAIDSFVRRQLSGALARLDTDVVAIDVYLKDTNGPRGGRDKLALIRVRLRNRQLVTIESLHDDLYAAISNGVKRTKRAVRRHARKTRRIERQPLRDFVPQATNLRVPWI